MRDSLSLVVNGTERRLEVDAARSLLEVLRDELGLIGCKYGCGEGQCGACTVLLDDAPVRSCRVSIGSTAGSRVRTIEGLADGADLHPVQAAFVTETAMQCGYCTPGMILAAVALLEREPAPSERAVIAALDGNLCRCGTYPRILRAVERAARAMQEDGK